MPPNPAHPTADRFIGQVEPAFGKQFLDVAIAQGEADIEPNCMLDDGRREAVAAVVPRVRAGPPGRLRTRLSRELIGIGARFVIAGTDTNYVPAGARHDTAALRAIKLD